MSDDYRQVRFRTGQAWPSRRRARGIATALAGPLVLLLGVFASARAIAADGARLELRKSDHIAIIGNALADRMQHDGWLEALIYQANPDADLVFRNLAFSCDEVVTRLRTDTGATRTEWLHKVGADVVLAFFGFNESFAGSEGLPRFKEELAAFIEETRKADYSGKGAPRLVLFSPIAAEKMADPNLADPAADNRNLAAYAAAMREVCKDAGVQCVDLFSATQKLYSEAKAPLTFNGIHLTEVGDRALAPAIFAALFGSPCAPPGPALERLRATVVERNETWHDRYRTVDSFNIYGGRSKLSYESGRGGGKVTNAKVMQAEMSVRDVMTANRDKRIWAVARGGDAPVADDNLPPVPEVKTNYAGPKPDGSHAFLGGEEAIGHMTMPKGCKVNLFASEEQFPELIKPVQMAWDTKGRLWVALWPNYPERTPTSSDGDKLVVLEDTDGDGRADKITTFASDLNCPTGFQFYKDGVLVMRSPDLLFLRDTDGDGKADWKERVLMGLDAADSHHETNSMVIDQGGAMYLSDGVFMRTQVETAAGPVRNIDGAIYRYEPLSQKFERYIAYGFANPHGRVFDYWGDDLITDGTSNSNYYGPALSGHLDFPAKHGKMQQFWRRPSRPCAGTGILSSRHFPAEFQNNFLNCNVIGKQGIFRVRMSEDGSGLKGDSLEDLVMSDDPQFRPCAVNVGPDGAVYFADWSNAIIGHMQHHLRDPNRDHVHGRIYRMTYPERPLLKPARIDGQAVPALLELLKEPEDNVRARAQLELAKHDPAEVIAAVDAWAAALDQKAPDHPHHLMYALWTHQWFNSVDAGLLKTLLRSPDYHVRAASTRVLCYWRDRVPGALALLKAQAEDEHPRVRLEAVRAASFFSGADLRAAYEVLFTSLKRPSDYYLGYAYTQTLNQLKSLSKEPILPDDPALAALAKKGVSVKDVPDDEPHSGPARALKGADLKSFELGRAVFARDAHCATCHQANGQGLPNIYPPLTNKDWVGGTDERIVKIALNGLWGALEVEGKRFDPAKGVPPMPGFGPLLKDDELAGVLTYVRQSFGNDYDPVKSDLVRKLRKATEAKAGFYRIEELMKEHPIPGWETWSATK